MPDTIRVLLVDDQYLIREGIASLLELEPNLEVVGTANGHEAVTQAAELSPDIILMDIRMPKLNGVEATIQIKKHSPACQIIMLTTFNDDEFVVQSLLAGACGYLMKDIPPADLAAAIRSAHAGVYQLAPEVAGKLVGSLQPPPKKPETPAPDASLTARELEVLGLLAQGSSNKEIAKAFGVSEGTIKNHVSNILLRLELRDRTQAAVYAVRRGLV